jgi:hypothetical protein
MSAAKSSRANRNRKQEPRSAIEKRNAQGVPTGRTRGKSRSNTAPVRAFPMIPAKVGIGASAAVRWSTRNCLGCIPMKTQYARNRRVVNRDRAGVGRQSSEAIFHVARRTAICP